MAAKNTVEATLRSRYHDGISEGLRRARGAMQNALDDMDRRSRSTALSTRKVADEIDRVATAARRATVPISAMMAAGAGGALKLAADMEAAEIGFTTMLGSAEKARAFLGELQQFAAKTPFQFDGLVTTSSRLMAMGFAAGDVVPMLRAVGDAAAAIGGGQEKIDRITMALSQMRAKGKVSAEEMLQLAEAGIPAWDILARAIGVTIPQAMKLAEKGAINANGAVQVLIQGMSERFGGRMEALSSTLTGQFSNLMDNVKMTGTVIGQQFLPDATRAVQKANELLAWAKDSAIAFQALPTPIRNTTYAIAGLTLVAGPASWAIGGIAGGLKAVIGLAGGFAAAGTTIKTVSFAIEHGLTGALVGKEALLLGILKLLPPVAVGLGTWWGGKKLLQHAQGNKELDTTAKAIKEINDRMRENPQVWNVTHGAAPAPMPAKKFADRVIDYMLTSGAKPKAPALLNPPDPEALKKEAEKIAAQQEKLRDLTQDIWLRMANDRQAAYVKLVEDYRKIDELQKTSGQARLAAKRLADAAYEATLKEIAGKEREAREKERQEEAEHQKALAQILAEAQEQRTKKTIEFLRWIYLAPIEARAEAEKKAREQAQAAGGSADALAGAIALARRGRGGLNGAELARLQAEAQRVVQARIEDLSRRPNRTAEDIAEIVRLHGALDRLNQLRMDPFHQTMQAMRQSLTDMTSQGVQAWASFWSDLVSGQEGSGKKLLAAFVGMIGQMLVRMGTMLVMSGIAEVALAHTLVGRFMGASAAAGYKAIATGLIVAAAGGALMGAASALAQTNKSGDAGNSFQQDVPRPTTSQQVQVIQVGAPGRAQSAGQVATAQPLELRVKVESNDSHIVRVVEKNVHDNGRLRTVIQNA